MGDVLPPPSRENVSEAERVMCDSTPVSLSFLEAWVNSTSSVTMWEFIYTGSGDNTPSLVNMPTAMNNIKENFQCVRGIRRSAKRHK